MQATYQARWISRQRLDNLRRSGSYRNGMVLEHLSGKLVIEPVGSDMGDGPILSPEETNYELQPSWLLGPRATIEEARRRVGLESEQMAKAGRN